MTPMERGRHPEETLTKPSRGELGSAADCKRQLFLHREEEEAARLPAERAQGCGAHTAHRSPVPATINTSFALLLAARQPGMIYNLRCRRSPGLV